MLFLGRLECVESGNGISLSAECPGVQPKLKMCKKLMNIAFDVFGLENRKWEELTNVIPG